MNVNEQIDLNRVDKMSQEVYYKQKTTMTASQKETKNFKTWFLDIIATEIISTETHAVQHQNSKLGPIKPNYDIKPRNSAV